MEHHEQSRRPSASAFSPSSPSCRHIHSDYRATANNKKYEPAYDGAKFDQSGYCLKHPMIRLCRPAKVSVEAAAAVASSPDGALPRGSESSSSSQEDAAAYSSCPEDNKNGKSNSNSSTSPPVKYLIIRKTCPMCGEHALRNERKINKPGWAHGYQPPKLMERKNQQMMVASGRHDVHHQLLSSPVRASSAFSSRSSAGERSRSKSSSARKHEDRPSRRGSSRSSSHSHRQHGQSDSGNTERGHHRHECRGSTSSIVIADASNERDYLSNSFILSSSSASICSQRQNKTSRELVRRASTTDVFQSHRHLYNYQVKRGAVGMGTEGDSFRRLHTTEALMNHPRNSDDDNSPLVNSNRRIARTKAREQVHVPRGSSIYRRNTICAHDNNESTSSIQNDNADNITTTANAAKRSSSITRSIQSKLESRIQSRRSFISSLHSNRNNSILGNTIDTKNNHDGSNSTIDISFTMNDSRTLSSGTTGKSFLSSSSSSLQKYRELQQQQPKHSSLPLSPRTRRFSLSLSAEDQDNMTREVKGRSRSLLSRRGSQASVNVSRSHTSRNESHTDEKKDNDDPYPSSRLRRSRSRSSSLLSSPANRSFSRKSSMETANTLSTQSLATSDSGSGNGSGNGNDDSGGSHRRSGRSRSRTKNITAHNENTTADNVVNTQLATLSYKPRRCHNRCSLSRNAERVLKTTSTMDGNNDWEPSTSLTFEVPFHPVTGMCHYHPGVCLAVKNIGNGSGGWKVVREVCPRCTS